jgi:hypothetical protein
MRAGLDSERLRAYERARYYVKRKPSSDWQRKSRARTAVRNAIRDGRLVRGKCEVCGEPDAQAHHDNYDQPLAVRWLCQVHHTAEHTF